MRIPFAKLFADSPFEGIQEHAEKLNECAWAFQQAIECFIADNCETFEEFWQEVIDLEHEADAIKRRIRGHLPASALLPVNKFLIFRYLREQDSVLDSVKSTLDWLSYRPDPGIPKELQKDFSALIEAVMEPIEQLHEMVKAARQYFETFSEEQRDKVKSMVRDLRDQEHKADKLEAVLYRKIFTCQLDPVTVYHMGRLVEITGSIADHAENTGDMMRAMLSK